MERPFDVVLWGATGFTGALVAEYLLRHAPGSLRLALAGRRRVKLEGLRESLRAIDERAAALPLLVGDSFDRASLDKIVSQTRVLCTTVGPYAKYGEAVVAACAEAGTHYCDLTGEPPFIRQMIDRYGASAEASGARIVHCCGFDSIPSDLGVWMMHRAFQEKGGRLERVRFFAGESRGGASGGTIASMLHMVDEVKRDRSVLRVLGDPYSLYPEGEPRGRDGSDPKGIGRDADLAMFTAPFVMASINSKIVRRSNALLGYPYGRDFRYSEQMSTGRGVQGFARAVAITGAVGAMVPALAMPPLRSLLERRLPKPGDGPSREKREAGYFVCRLIADGVDNEGQALQLRGRVEGTSDPGYGETAKMLGESALCLAFDELGAPGGSRTPASTMGDALLARLRAAGMMFRVEA